VTDANGNDSFEELKQLFSRLRAPDGCPWDRKQTHASLRPYLIEESYEVLQALDDGDLAKLREELGDLLLQVMLHAQIASEEGAFTIDDVIQTLSDKLIHRHPHVFGDVKVKDLPK
jgi:tetrapyrrole methylase family protein/MazG family protein